MSSELYKIIDLVNLNRKEIVENYKEYVNPGLASLITLMSMDRDYIKASGVYVWDKDGQDIWTFRMGAKPGHNH